MWKRIERGRFMAQGLLVLPGGCWYCPWGLLVLPGCYPGLFGLDTSGVGGPRMVNINASSPESCALNIAQLSQSSHSKHPGEES